MINSNTLANTPIKITAKNIPAMKKVANTDRQPFASASGPVDMTVCVLYQYAVPRTATTSAKMAIIISLCLFS